MVTRLLHLCGLTLGPARDLLRPRPCNPEGFWENRSFLRINEAILREMGGAWDDPPRHPPIGWEASAALEPLAARARRLLRPFRRCEPWGWKDPRNCLTLPFWTRLIPDLRVLLCVRNPLAVAESLRRRDAMSSAAGINLWLTYNRHALEGLAPGCPVITHYESYFSDPAAELQRVLALLEVPFLSEDVQRACSSIQPTLLHHRASDDELASADVPGVVLECYRSLAQPQEGAAEHSPLQRTGR